MHPPSPAALEPQDNAPCPPSRFQSRWCRTGVILFAAIALLYFSDRSIAAIFHSEPLSSRVIAAAASAAPKIWARQSSAPANVDAQAHKALIKQKSEPRFRDPQSSDSETKTQWTTGQAIADQRASTTSRTPTGAERGTAVVSLPLATAVKELEAVAPTAITASTLLRAPDAQTPGPLVTFNTSGISTAVTTFSATQKDTGVSNTPTLSRVGLTAVSRTGSFTSSSNLITQNTPDLSQKYVTFTVTPNADTVLIADSLSYSVSGSNTAPNRYVVGYSTNGFTSFNSMSGTVTGTDTAATYDFVNLITNDSIEFRFQNYGTSAVASSSTVASTGTFRLGSSATAIQVQGSTASTSGDVITLTAATEIRNSTALNLSSTISGNFGVTKTGAGVLTLTGANGYTGTTQISAGTLQLGDGTSGRDGTLASTSIVNNSSLIYNRFGSATYSGAISGSGTVTKAGAGIQTLTGNNSFSGSTRVSAGTLQLSGTSTNRALGGTSDISVDRGGTLLFGANNQIRSGADITLGSAAGEGNAILSTGGYSQDTSNRLGALTLTGGGISIIDFATNEGSNSILAFAESDSSTWNGTLNIYNWTGTPRVGGGIDQLYFGTGGGGLNTSQLSQINFFSDAGFTSLGTGMFYSPSPGTFTGEVVPVPEPGTWAAGILSVLAVGFTQRKRFKRHPTKAAA
jgi:autotransporter-associated beta strand protein